MTLASPITRPLLLTCSLFVACSDTLPSPDPAGSDSGGTARVDPSLPGGGTATSGSSGATAGGAPPGPGGMTETIVTARAGAGGATVHPTCPGDAGSAFEGSPPALPGAVEAEDYDPEGYSDASTGNEGGGYREDDVDIKAQGGGHVVGWMTSAEWLEYTVYVRVAGSYRVTFAIGAVEPGRTLELSQCGTSLGDPIAVPQIADWGTTRSVTTAPIALSAGLQVLRVTVGGSDFVDFDSMRFDLEEPGSGGAGGVGGEGNGGGSPGGEGGDGAGQTCPLPTTLNWTSTGPLARPSNEGALSLKDFTVTKYGGKYLVYGTTADGNWNGFMSTFTSFDEWDTATQHYIPGLVAPTLFYFSPKDVWVLAYQWGFKYATSKTPDDPSSWSTTQPLINYDPDATGGAGVGPIDQTIICDDTDCYIFYNDDAGGVYRGSMPIGSFPGKFTNDTKIMQEPTSVVFEGIQVYSVKGSDQYLMIMENNGIRAFRAWTSTTLSGTWTPLVGASTTAEPFAGENNVTWPDGKWTRDISHGDLVREDPSEKMLVDPCNLQMLYQGRDPDTSVAYIDLPYRPGLLTLQR